MRKLLCSLLGAALVITALLPFAGEAADKQVVTISCASNTLVVVAAFSANAPAVESKECAQAIADTLGAGLKLNNVGSVGTGFVVYTFIK